MMQYALLNLLLAPMLLYDSTRNARVSAGGEIVLLEEQDHRFWDTDPEDVGLAYPARAQPRRSPE